MSLPDLAPLDIALLVVIALLAIHGAAAGFVNEFFSKLAVLAGCAAAVLFFRKGAPLAEQITGLDSVSGIIAFLAIFIAVYFVIKIVQRIAKGITFNPSINALDRALGIFLGAAEGLLVAAVVVVFLVQQPFFDASSLLAESFFAELFGPISGLDLLEAVPQATKEQVAPLLQ